MKKFVSLVCGAMFAFSSVCFATIPNDQIAIENVKPGMRIADLIAMHGQPLNKHKDDWIYENFRVEVDDDYPDIVEEIETRSRNAVTPTGVSVGQSADVLNSAYGRADKIENEWNETEYEYYSNDYTQKIKFKVVNGIITKISCKVRN